MVVVAYVAGLMTPVAAVLGAFGGMWWWRAYRRAQAASEPMHLTPLVPPPPLPPQDRPRVSHVRYNAVQPGNRRHVRGRRK